MITEQKLRQIRAKVELLESQLDAMIGVETQGLWAVGDLDLGACRHRMWTYLDGIQLLDF